MKVLSEVRVELPLGRRMRSSCGEVGSAALGWSKSLEGGVQDEIEDFKVFES